MCDTNVYVLAHKKMAVWRRLAESAEMLTCSRSHEPVRQGSIILENAVSFLQHPVGMHRSVENAAPFPKHSVGMHPVEPKRKTLLSGRYTTFCSWLTSSEVEPKTRAGLRIRGIQFSQGRTIA